MRLRKLGGWRLRPEIRIYDGKGYVTLVDGAGYPKVLVRFDDTGELGKYDSVQLHHPIYLKQEAGKSFYWFHDEIYEIDEVDLADEVVDVLFKDYVLRRRRSVDRATARVSAVANLSTRRQGIPDDVKMFVWQRGEGGCVRCRATADLEFDHIIPVAMGGSDTARNLQLLCATCNCEKGGNLD